MNVYEYLYIKQWCFPGGPVVKDLPANAENAGDAGLIPGLGRSPGGGMATHYSILARRISKEILQRRILQRSLVGFSPWVAESYTTEWLSTHAYKTIWNNAYKNKK